VGLGWSTKALTAAGIDAQTRENVYDANGNLKVQALLDDTRPSTEAAAHVWYQYDAAGRVLSVNNSNHAAGYARQYNYAYANAGDGNAVQTVTAWSVKQDTLGTLEAIVGQTTSTYDANGFLVAVAGSSGNSGDTRTLVNDAQGHVLRRTQRDSANSAVWHVTTSLIANAQEIGSASDARAANPSTFNQNFTPITDQNIAGGASTLTVQTGQTLQASPRWCGATPTCGT
jgi:hypothetical protein